MRKSVILTLLTVANAAVNGNDAASLLQVHDKGSPSDREAQRGQKASREASAGLAPLLEAVTARSAAMEDLWASSYEGEEVLKKEWMANSSGGSLGVMRMVSGDDVERADAMSRATIWIPAQPRSGSTLLMDMLSIPITFGSNGTIRKSMRRKFVLFEPCHPGDVANGATYHKPQNQGEINACGQMIEDLARCNFSSIEHLDGWDRNHSKMLPQPYERRTAKAACRHSKLVVFKSVFMPRDAWSFVRSPLEHVPSLHAVMNVRDPRAVLASQLRVFARSLGFHFNANLKQVCQSYASVSWASHPRLLVVKFEDMVRDPRNTIKRMYTFLGLHYGMRQEDWIQHRFGHTKDCREGESNQGQNYTTCDRGVEKTINKWRSELEPKDLRDWPSNACRRVAEHFNYK